jgi:hypothetical protein
MRKFLLTAAALLVAAAHAAFAQGTSASARLPAGKQASVNAVKPAEGAAYLEIALPSGTQKLEGLGDGFLPLRSGGREMLLATADLNKDGTDEVVVRGKVTDSASAVMVFQWDAAQNQFVPVPFTNSDDEEKPFLFADAASSVAVERNLIEVRLTRVDQSGRSVQVTERYHWDGNGIKYLEDH